MSGTIIITGSGRGIGAATALLAAKKGYVVCVNYASRSDRAEQVVNAIRETGSKAIAVKADVSDEKAVQRLFDTAEAELGPVTALVNNAGIIGKISRLADSDTDNIRHIIETNLLGTIFCSREAVRRMPKNGGGVIVNISSRAAQYGSPNEFVQYAATKAAIESFTFGLAGEVGKEGIRVCCVSPGVIETEMHAEAGDAGRVQRFAAGVPLQRAGKPEEVAAAVLWLLSEEASYSTGTILSVSGGR
jgi:glucose 1-dehydrogenase